VGVDAPRLAHPAQLGPEPRSLRLVAADADVDVVALREDPAVTAANDRDLEEHPAGEALLPRVVRLERDAVDDPLREAELLSRGAVAAVRADHDPRVELARVDGHALAHLGARVGGPLEEEVVEPLPLRHVRERGVGASREAVAIAQAAVHPVDRVLDDRLDRERQEPRSAAGHAAAARLVAREPRLVDHEDPRAGAREPERRDRSRRAAADDRDVGAHETTRRWNVRSETSVSPIEPPTSASPNAQTGMCGSSGVSDVRSPSLM